MNWDMLSISAAVATMRYLETGTLMGALGLPSTPQSSPTPVKDFSVSPPTTTKFSLDGNGGNNGQGGRAWVESLPDGTGPQREQAIRDAIDRGFTRSINWVPVTSTSGGRSLTLYVMDDALAVGTDDDWVRISCTHETNELVARSWTTQGNGCYVLTSKVCDLVAENADPRLSPTILSGDPKWFQIMDTTRAMIHFHELVEGKRAGRTGLVSDAGKYWVNTPRLGTSANPTRAGDGGIAAANYGFYAVDEHLNYLPHAVQGSHTPDGVSHGPGGWAVFQNVGLMHSANTQADYSQKLRMMGQLGQLDTGEQVDLQDVALDPNLCHLLSDEGPVLLRHPGI